jgi:tetratricopeptide (TPR) repeat protein
MVDAAALLADAQLRYHSGDLDGAIQAAQAAARAGGGTSAHLLAGLALGKKGQLQEAEHEFATALRLDPANQLAAQRLREIRDRLRSSP